MFEVLQFFQNRWAYLIQTDPDAGGVSAFMGLIWLAMAVIGYRQLRKAMPSNPVRAAFRRRLALSLVTLGALGVLLLLVRWLDGSIIQPADENLPGVDNLPVIDWRLWSYLVLLATVAVATYFYRYYRGPYKQQVAETRGVRVVQPRTRREQPEPRERAVAAESANEIQERTAATTARRDSRRDRKRRKR